MRKFGYALFLLLFLGVCLFPGAATLLWGESGPAANEVLSPKPKWTDSDGGVNLNALSEAGDYFSDHFAFRQELVTADAMLKSGLFRTSAQSQVALGQGDWLFYAETLDDCTGLDTITDRQAFCIARSLQLAREYLLSQGRELLFTVAPNKISLYPEYSGRTLSQVAPTAAERLKAVPGFESSVNYLDLFQLFGSRDEVLYHQLDSHWTLKGAALAHDDILNALGLVRESAWDRPGAYRNTHKGDLYEMLYPASDRLDLQWEFDRAPLFTYDSPIKGPDDLRISTSCPTGEGNLLMFRDSFGNTLHTLLAEDFAHAMFSRAMPYDLGLAEQIDADYVVVEIVERNLSLLAENAFLMPAPDRRAEKDPSFHQEQSGAPAAAQSQAEPRLPGYVRLSGSIADSCDADSLLMLETASGGWYELSPAGKAEDGGVPFTACLPQDEDLAGALVVYVKNKVAYAAQLQVQPS